MNISKLVTRIKLSLGIYSISLPIENLDDFILTVIEDITLPVFSIYCPFQQILHLNVKTLELLQKTDSFESYLLPDFQERKLLSVKNIVYDDSSLYGYSTGLFPYIYSGVSQDLMISNATANLISNMMPSLTFHFEAPRTITLYNCLSSYSLIFTLLFEHDKSFASITPTSEESFYKLAELDVKQALYGTMKHYNDIQTAYGNINLKIDDWASATEDRKSLLSEWDEKYHLDYAQSFYG